MDEESEERGGGDDGFYDQWTPGFKPPKKPEREELQGAWFILGRGSITVVHMAIIGDVVRVRAADEESTASQWDREADVLRAQLLFASTTLDAVVQNLLKKAQGDVLSKSAKARRELAGYVDSLIAKAVGPATAATGKEARGLLADAISWGPAGRRLAAARVDEMCEGSFQSFPRLCEAAKVLGLGESPEFLTTRKSELSRVFKTRNDIAHRLDLKDVTSSEVNPRDRDQVTKDSAALLLTAAEFIEHIAEVLGPPLPPLFEGFPALDLSSLKPLVDEEASDETEPEEADGEHDPDAGAQPSSDST